MTELERRRRSKLLHEGAVQSQVLICTLKE